MKSGLIPAAVAATRLGVKPATLYAYVSRGRLTAYPRDGHRGSWFDPLQVDALIRRARRPVDERPDLRIASAITLIERGQYWYRGQSPGRLAATRSYEEVAEWLWTGRVAADRPMWPIDAAAVASARAANQLLPKDATATDRLRVIVAVLGAGDRLRSDLRPAGAVATARRLVAATAAALSRRRGSIAKQAGSWLSARPLSEKAVRAIDHVLILMGDHELAASTLAVRVAASFKADPYAAVVAGLGAMGGTRHGGAGRQVEDMLDEVRRARSADGVVGRLLAMDSSLPGFGHPLYPDGDPRAAAVLALARTFEPTLEADAVVGVAAGQGIHYPNVDFALATFARTLRLSPGAGEALFALGRLAGWLAHAIEEYTGRTDFRLRAVYTGVRPD